MELRSVLLSLYFQRDCGSSYWFIQSVVWSDCRFPFVFIQETIQLFNDQSEGVGVRRAFRHGAQPMPALRFVG